MLTKIIMGFIVLFLGLLWLFCDKKGKQTTFFNKTATSSMRGFWCLIILLVHIPKAYQNPIQDLIGSFAYIGVTFFFMTSGYGLMLSAGKNIQTFKQSFWSKRLPRLLLPMFFVNVISIISGLFSNNKFKVWDLFFITGWVRQLLLFYFIFWFVFCFVGKKLSFTKKSYIVCLIILFLSILFFITKGKIWFAWPTESLGFIYGILLYEYKDKLYKYAVSKWWVNCAVVCVLCLLLGVLYLKIKNITFLGDYVVKALLGLSILIFIMFMNAKIPIGNAINRFLGEISYEVYLIHSVSFEILKLLPVKFDSGVFIISSILITVILSLIVKVLSKFVLDGFNCLIKGVKNA